MLCQIVFVIFFFSHFVRVFEYMCAYGTIVLLLFVFSSFRLFCKFFRFVSLKRSKSKCTGAYWWYICCSWWASSFLCLRTFSNYSILFCSFPLYTERIHLFVLTVFGCCSHHFYLSFDNFLTFSKSNIDMCTYVDLSVHDLYSVYTCFLDF